jgi:hypothetical protein
MMDQYPDCDNEELALAIIAGWERGLRVPRTITAQGFGSEAPRRYVGMSQAGRCRRQIVLGRREDYEPSPLSARQLDTFGVGHLLEADTRACLEAGGIPVSFDQFSVQYWTAGGSDFVRGHIDGLVPWLLHVAPESEAKQPGYDAANEREVCFSEYPHSHLSIALWEHKKLGDYPWKLCIGKKGFKRDAEMENVIREEDGGYVLRQGTLQRVQHEYYQQMQCYMLALQMRDIPVTRGIFIGRNPDAKAICVEVVDFDAPEAEASLARLSQCVNDYHNGLIPIRDKTPGKDWECDYCAYRGVCDDLGPGDGPIEKPLLLEVADG